MSSCSTQYLVWLPLCESCVSGKKGFITTADTGGEKIKGFCKAGSTALNMHIWGNVFIKI